MFVFIQACNGQSGNGFLPHASPASAARLEAAAEATGVGAGAEPAVVPALEVAGGGASGGTIELGEVVGASVGFS